MATPAEMRAASAAQQQQHVNHNRIQKAQSLAAGIAAAVTMCIFGILHLFEIDWEWMTFGLTTLIITVVTFLLPWIKNLVEGAWPHVVKHHHGIIIGISAVIGSIFASRGDKVEGWLAVPLWLMTAGGFALLIYFALRSFLVLIRPLPQPEDPADQAAAPADSGEDPPADQNDDQRPQPKQRIPLIKRIAGSYLSALVVGGITAAFHPLIDLGSTAHGYLVNVCVHLLSWLLGVGLVGLIMSAIGFILSTLVYLIARVIRAMLSGREIKAVHPVYLLLQLTAMGIGIFLGIIIGKSADEPMMQWFMGIAATVVFIVVKSLLIHICWKRFDKRIVGGMFLIAAVVSTLTAYFSWGQVAYDRSHDERFIEARKAATQPMTVFLSKVESTCNAYAQMKPQGAHANAMTSLHSAKKLAEKAENRKALKAGINSFKDHGASVAEDCMTGKSKKEEKARGATFLSDVKLLDDPSPGALSSYYWRGTSLPEGVTLDEGAASQATMTLVILDYLPILFGLIALMVGPMLEKKENVLSHQRIRKEDVTIGKVMTVSPDGKVTIGGFPVAPPDVGLYVAIRNAEDSHDLPGLLKVIEDHGPDLRVCRVLSGEMPSREMLVQVVETRTDSTIQTEDVTAA